MAKIKSFTDLQQSRKLAEILPLESADGFWEYHDKWYSEGDEWEGYEDYPRAEPYLEYTRKENEWKEEKQDVPCWSLTALLEVLKQHCERLETTLRLNKNYNVFASGDGFTYRSFDEYPDGISNLIDACVAIIEKLHELKML